MEILNEIRNWGKCINPQISDNENYFESYQKFYRDDENFVKYIIYIDHFIYHDYHDLNHKLIAGARFRYKQDTIDIHYIIGEETTLNEVEEFFENVWGINHCKYES